MTNGYRIPDWRRDQADRSPILRGQRFRIWLTRVKRSEMLLAASALLALLVLVALIPIAPVGIIGLLVVAAGFPLYQLTKLITEITRDARNRGRR